MLEISENLHRAALERDEHIAEWIRLAEKNEKGVSSQVATKLTALERDEYIAEWIRLAEKKAKGISSQVATKSKSDSNPNGAGRHDSGVRKAARELGIGKDEAHRATKVAGLSDEAKQAARSALLRQLIGCRITCQKQKEH
ncbi:MAG: hypothetical protein FJX40_04440 [Alphaproteobacteria bacterium]|nr:hypothetical protein [Alphaproteobacteria bacterium]